MVSGLNSNLRTSEIMRTTDLKSRGWGRETANRNLLYPDEEANSTFVLSCHVMLSTSKTPFFTKGNLAVELHLAVLSSL